MWSILAGYNLMRELLNHGRQPAAFGSPTLGLHDYLWELIASTRGLGSRTSRTQPERDESVLHLTRFPSPHVRTKTRVACAWQSH